MARRKTVPRNDPHYQTLGDLPDWLKLKMAAQTAAWGDGSVRTCAHIPRPTSTVFVHMCAWMPDLVTCSHCTHLAALAETNPETHRCDCCGRFTDGSPDDRVYSGQVTFGTLTYAFAVCSTCRVHNMKKS